MFFLDGSGVSWLQQVLKTLNDFDQWLFLKINTQWTSNFLDNIYPWYRDANTWLPLYLFLLLFVLLNFGWRIWPWVLFFIVTVALCDQVSSTLLKNLFDRTRPCHNPDLADRLRLLVVYCPGSGSFTSSHATNHFGMACFIFFTLRKYLKNWAYLFFVWAATISYGQVYVGIHYPFDVLGGAVTGCIIGIITATVFNNRISLPPLLKEQKNSLPVRN